jgi:Family of unknown function (DUF6636)
MGLLVGGLGVAVIALVVVVVILLAGSSDDSTTKAQTQPSSSTAEQTEGGEELCAVVESGGPAKLDLSLSGLDCEEGRAIQLALVKLGQSGATGVLEVGEWLCTREPLSEYPTLTRCRADDGRQLNVLGTAPHAHLTPTEQAQARSTSGSEASQRQAPKPVFFETPSGNITCGLSRRGVTCEIFRKSYTPYIPKPPSCPLDYGHRLSVGAYGPAQFDCYGDSMRGLAAGATLPYGNEIRRGRIGCLSKEAGLICETVAGTGFLLSVQSVKLL